MDLLENCDLKDVIISIKGTQQIGTDDQDSMELVTEGKYFYDEEGSFFYYWESELTGLEGTVTSFSVMPGSVLLQREGSVSSRMEFEEGQKTVFLYDTPVGGTNMGLDTFRIISSFNDGGGDLVIDYMLDIEHKILGRNKFVITVREKKRVSV